MSLPTNFKTETISPELLTELKNKAHQSRGDILHMTTLSASGHPGGSMSSMEILTLVYNLYDRQKDKFVISCGHISPGAYSALGRSGHTDLEEAISGFRLAGSKYPGHVETIVDGVAWDTGNLGQGMSIAAAFAWARKNRNDGGHVFCLMGDGEQQKGQLSEARDLAKKMALNNLICFVDRNHLQISGKTEDVMDQDLTAMYQAAGWQVIDCDAHDLSALYVAIRQAMSGDKPTLILAASHMGHGVSFMEDLHKYHGSTLSEEKLAEALVELGIENRLAEYRLQREKLEKALHDWPVSIPDVKVDTGAPRQYETGKKVALRDAYGNALLDIAKLNNQNGQTIVVGVDCDLSGSTKMSLMEKEVKTGFLQVGIQEHNAAAFAGALTHEGYSVFFSTFGVFGVCEGYNQQRLNDLNHTRLNMVLTHCGLDVGEDGKTHQSIDHVGVMRNFFGYEAIIPADANQMDQAVRYAATRQKNVFIGMGRSAYPILEKEDGTALFGEGYRFEYGQDNWLRKGKDGVIFALGHMAAFALDAREILQAEGLDIGVVVKSCPKTTDAEVLEEALALPFVCTLEDHNTETGIGSVIAGYIAESKHRPIYRRFGVTRYGASGNSKDLYNLYQLDGSGVADRIRHILKGTK